MAAIFKTKVSDTIEFAYQDSGPPPNKTVYETIILIHGHTYHNGTFKPMLEQANSFGYRIILPNRRLYPGSTPYTKEEFDALGPNNSAEEVTEAYIKQGEYLLLFVNNVIKEHNLKNVILVGWSLGTAFLSVTVAAIKNVNQDIQGDLRKAVKSIVWWDPPASSNGIEDPPTGGWVPLYDETLTPEERGQAFGLWLSQYFAHKELEKKDCHTLAYKETDPTKTPSFTGISIPELLTKIELTGGANGDNYISARGHFEPATIKARQLSFFDKQIRSAWGNIPLCLTYGEQSPYNVVWGAWKLEEEAVKTGLPLKVKSMPGANHFAMEDRTELVFETLKALTA